MVQLSAYSVLTERPSGDTQRIIAVVIGFQTVSGFSAGFTVEPIPCGVTTWTGEP